VDRVEVELSRVRADGEAFAVPFQALGASEFLRELLQCALLPRLRYPVGRGPA